MQDQTFNLSSTEKKEYQQQLDKYLQAIQSQEEQDTTDLLKQEIQDLFDNIPQWSSDKDKADAMIVEFLRTREYNSDTKSLEKRRDI